LTTIKKRAHINHSDPLEVAIFSAHSKTKIIAGHTDHVDGFIYSELKQHIMQSSMSLTFFFIMYS
jgi:cystathionine beta-lyase/cystathionine gamma-synthase